MFTLIQFAFYSETRRKLKLENCQDIERPNLDLYMSILLSFSNTLFLFNNYETTSSTLTSRIYHTLCTIGHQGNIKFNKYYAGQNDHMFPLVLRKTRFLLRVNRELTAELMKYVFIDIQRERLGLKI